MFLFSEKNISGKAITPFVLKKVSDISHGKSLEASIFSAQKNLICFGFQWASM